MLITRTKMNFGVIEIPSSPELGPTQPRKQVRQTRPPRRVLPPGDPVIILTDSEEEEVPQKPVLERARPRPGTPSRSQPRGSHKLPLKSTRKDKQPLFLPDPYELEPGPSNRPAMPPRRSPSLVDEEEHQVEDREFVPLSASQPGSLLEIEPEVPAADHYVAQVLEIVPDVDPTHASELIERYREHKDQVVQRVLHTLFEDPAYPKIDKSKMKGKRKRENDDDNEGERRHSKQLVVDQDIFLQKDPTRVVGQYYFDIALVRQYHILSPADSLSPSRINCYVTSPSSRRTTSGLVFYAKGNTMPSRSSHWRRTRLPTLVLTGRILMPAPTLTVRARE